MKFGIVTVQNAVNFGAALQAYSLCANVRNFCDCDIIDYRNDSAVWGAMGAGLKNRLRRQMIKAMYTRRKANFENFWENSGFISAETYPDRAALRNADSRYSAFIAGSDQIWNPPITGGDTSFFLDFVTGDATRRLSYAASFGSSAVVGALHEGIIAHLGTYGALSVREPQSAQALRNRLPSREIFSHIDPAFLTNDKQWAALASKPPQGKYVLLYMMRSADDLIEYAQELARSIDTRIYMLPVGLNRKPGIRYFTNAGPSEFLGLAMGASHIITNSFHGAAFSLIFKKPFTIKFHLGQRNANERFANLVSMFELEGRCLSDSHKPDFTYEPDFDLIDRRIKEQVSISTDYLRSLCGKTSTDCAANA